MLIASNIARTTTASHVAAGHQRLRHRATGEYLHLSGSGTTTRLQYAWLGTQRQADELQARAAATGQPWPFAMINRSAVDHTPQPIDWKGTA
ncbi:hypothetical protein [Thalassovita sp.]|uniref:hypothetical protein n=1 Tax=Thalassovita sp. TaxID=1979401 RepID=UPI002B2701AE|nr:hypothetical protein [Thalassovita sp.]